MTSRLVMKKQYLIALRNSDGTIETLDSYSTLSQAMLQLAKCKVPGDNCLLLIEVQPTVIDMVDQSLFNTVIDSDL